MLKLILVTQEERKGNILMLLIMMVANLFSFT